MKDTEIALPLLFIIEYALAGLLRHLGVAPKAMIGHSLGEYVAACVSGVFSYQDAIRIVHHRGRLMKKVKPGLMLSVSADVNTVRDFIQEDVAIGAVNGPEHCLLSGNGEKITQIKKVLDEQVFNPKYYISP